MKLFARNSTLELSHPHTMGILNVTPDSFSDGGRHYTLNQALTHTNDMIIAGATIIDVGGESSRPGSYSVDTQQELDRVVPVVEAIAQRFNVWISVDTSKPEVISQVAHSGAHMINDIRALRRPGALKAAAETGLPVCLMHMQGEPHAMQQAPKYDNVLKTISGFFIEQIKHCEEAGIKKSQLLIDPGFGFGKNFSHNYQMLAHLEEFHQFGLPLLVGMSRKNMIGELLNCDPAQRLSGSIACAVIAAMQGAHIIRVHDVKETVEAIRVVTATLRAR